MFETVSVDEALSKAKRMVNYPPLIILLADFIACFVLLFNNILPGWYVVVVAVAGFVLGWLYWSLAITKWRIWAFENVRNVHELKNRAIKDKLIWKDGSIWEKTEIRSADDREKLKMLEAKFKQPDIFIDDYTVPAEAVIHYSLIKSLLLILLMLALLGGGAYLAIHDHRYVASGGACILGIIFGFTGIKNAFNRSAQIIISEKGMQTASVPFCTWAEIRSEDVIVVGAGKSSTRYLVYNHPKGSARIDIDGFDIGKPALEKLLCIYRARFENAKQRIR